MKKLNLKQMVVMLSILASSLTVNLSAQEKGDMAVGGHVALGSGDNITNFGLGAKFRYNFTNPLRVEGEFSYFFEKDLVSMWDLGASLHFLFPVGKITVYPLAGVGLLGVSVNTPGLGGVNVSDNDFGFHFGGGIDFKVTDHISVNLQVKYRLSDNWSRLMATGGVAYTF